MMTTRHARRCGHGLNGDCSSLGRKHYQASWRHEEFGSWSRSPICQTLRTSMERQPDVVILPTVQIVQILPEFLKTGKPTGKSAD